MTNKQKYLYKDKASTEHTTTPVVVSEKTIKTSSSKKGSGVKAKSPATTTTKTPRKIYSDSFKREVVTALLSRTSTLKALEQRYKLRPNKMYKWKDQLLAKEPTLRNVDKQSNNNGTKKENVLLTTNNSSHQSSAISMIITKYKQLLKSIAQIFKEILFPSSKVCFE